jgi:DNA topoisomerase 2-associated protein PAT1
MSVWSCLIRSCFWEFNLASQKIRPARPFGSLSLVQLGMSFFGLEQNDLERDKQKFLDGGLQESEDVAVYTWGEDSYDGLGDALQEGGDELNDETFGGTDAVGEKADYRTLAEPISLFLVYVCGNQARTLTFHVQAYLRLKVFGNTLQIMSMLPKDSQRSIRVKFSQRQSINRVRWLFLSPSQTFTCVFTARLPQSLESIWDDKSPFSVLSRVNGGGRATDSQRATSSTTKVSPYLPSPQQVAARQPTSYASQSGVHTLQEIEAEMRASALASMSRHRQDSPQQLQAPPQTQQHHHLLQQQQQQQLQQQQLLQQQQIQQQQIQQQQLHQRTPPPRMMPQSQSPRFHLHQQQILLMQQQQEQRQQQRLQELQDQLRLEEIERQLRAQQISDRQQSPSHFIHQRQSSGPILVELQAAQAQQQRRQRSPAFADGQNMPLLSQQNMQHMPQSIQMQQRLLSEMAQAEFLRDLQGVTPAEQEALRMEAMRKIMETERMEEKRRRRAAKIAHMVSL